MGKFSYSVDTDQFSDIREQGLVYVDKTDLMYDITKRFRYVFLSRPRRFGKSLLCNTLDAYFNGRKELFEGLKIMELEHEWKKHPVFHFIMSGLKNLTVKEAKEKLEVFIRDYENIYGSSPAEKTPGTRFRGLIHRAHEQTGEKVVIILDEYDAPIMRLLNQQKESNEMRMMLREFYQVLKDEGQHIRFTFMTGVTKFSQLSIFSELNNLKNISMMPEYSGICGITQDEVDTALRPCVEEFAESLSISIGEAYALLKKHYDGYHFSPNSKNVYAPFSLLNALNDKQIKQYWFESGTMTSLVEHLRHYSISTALDYDGIKVGENEFNIPCENAETPMPLLYQSGYLTIDSYIASQNSYILHFPNLEVRSSMVHGLMPLILNRTTADSNALMFKMTDAIFAGNISDALLALRAYIAKIPYDIISKKHWKEDHESFYKLLLYMVFSMLNSIVETEVKSIMGRADVVIRTKTHVYVLELKVDGSVEDALTQIEDKGYSIPFIADGRKIVKCGVRISSQKRNIAAWRVVDEEGAILDDQLF